MAEPQKDSDIIVDLGNSVSIPLEDLPILSYPVWGNPLFRWIVALTAATVAYILLRLVFKFLSSKISWLSGKTKTELDDIVASAISGTHGVFLFAAALHPASLILELPDKTRTILSSFFVVTFLLQAGLWLTAILTGFVKRYIQARHANTPATLSMLGLVNFGVKIGVWSVVALLILDNLGIDITALVAGLGVGGIAVALAVQNVLGDLLSSLAIVLDKPFEVGDFIIVGDFMGSVEHIGIKTTRLRSISGEQLVFSNSDLLGSRIRNYKRMAERRVVFSIGVTYQTSKALLERIPDLIKESIESKEKIRFDRAHFKSFGDSALLFEAVYYVLEPDYALYMDIQQAVNFELLEQFEELGIEFAYPTQTLFLEKSG